MFRIGLDLGNFNSYPSAIISPNGDANPLNCTLVDLLPTGENDGIPSIFFYSQRASQRCLERGLVPPPWCGFDARNSRAVPSRNRIRYLKQHMNQDLDLDDWHGSYNDAVTLLVQYIVRSANKYLKQHTQETSTDLALAYPATFSPAQCLHLKRLAEAAELEDRRHVRVVGMIAEPAAAALDYLAENGRTAGETTVLTFDLGGGTLDLAIVKASPEGWINKDGKFRQYDIQDLGGDADIGGRRFDEVMRALLTSKLPEGASLGSDDELDRMAEEAKKELTQQTEWYKELPDAELGSFELTVTREEFEAASKPLVDAALQATHKILSKHKGRAPELIVLTGAASQMPMIQKSLEQEFPQYKGKVVSHRPSRAISYGAARFATEDDVVQCRVARDIGILYYHKENGEPYCLSMFSAGTEIPCTKQDRSYNLDAASTKTTYDFLEATTENPDTECVKQNYRTIISVTLTHSAGASLTTHLRIDDLGLIQVDAEEIGHPENKVTASYQLENLS